MSIDPKLQENSQDGDDLSGDVEIEITEDDLGRKIEADEGDAEEEEEEEDQAEELAEPEEALAEDEPEEKAPKRRRPLDKRLSDLARKAADAERRAVEAEGRLQRESSLREQSEQAMMTHYRNNLSATALDLKQKLAEARSMMDNENIDDLQYQFTKTMNDLEAVSNWEREQQNKGPRAAPEQRKAPEQAPQQQVSLDPRTADWVRKNGWFQPQSADFDQEMHEEATLYARRVERRYNGEDRGDEIGGVDYFTEIDRHMRREFPDAFPAQSTLSKRTPPMSRDSNVAPVQLSAPGQSTKTSKMVTLSQQQRQFARSMGQSGAYTHPNGSRMTDAEAEKYYAIHVKKSGKGA